MRAFLRAPGAMLGRLGRVLGTLAVGVAAGASVAALGMKALVLVPALALGAALMALPYSPLYIIAGTLPINLEIAGPITVSRLAVVFGVLVAVYQGVRGIAPMPRLTIWPEGFIALAFFLWIVLVAVVAGGGLLSQLGSFIIYAAVFFVILNFADSPERIRRTMAVIVAVGVLQGLLVAAEARLGFSPFGGWQAELAEERLEGQVRVVGASSHPILLAGFFQVMLGSAVFLLLTGARGLATKLILLGAIAICLLGWWSTFARSSWIGMAAMGFVAMVLFSQRTRILALSVGSVLFVGLWLHDFSPGALIRTVEGLAFVGAQRQTAGVAEGGESLSWRTENWRAALAMAADHPVFGVGIDRSPELMLSYMPPGATAHHYIPPAVPHNLFLVLLAEAGAPALLLFCLLLIAAVTGLRRAWAHADLRPFAIALAAIVSGQLATFFFNPIPREIWATLALSIVLGHIALARQEGPAPRLALRRFSRSGAPRGGAAATSDRPPQPAQ